MDIIQFHWMRVLPIWRAPKWKDGNTQLYQIAKHVNVKLDTFRNVAISILVRLKHCSILLIDVYLLPTKTQSQYTETWQGHAIGSKLYTSTGCFSRRFFYSNLTPNDNLILYLKYHSQPPENYSPPPLGQCQSQDGKCNFIGFCLIQCLSKLDFHIFNRASPPPETDQGNLGLVRLKSKLNWLYSLKDFIVVSAPDNDIYSLFISSLRWPNGIGNYPFPYNPKDKCFCFYIRWGKHRPRRTLELYSSKIDIS